MVIVLAVMIQIVLAITICVLILNQTIIINTSNIHNKFKGVSELGEVAEGAAGCCRKSPPPLTQTLTLQSLQ